MTNLALGIFAAAMLFASVRHAQAFVRRERVLRKMHANLAAVVRRLKEHT